MTNTSKEYSDALFSLAVEEGTLEETLHALRDVSEAVAAEKGAMELLASPAVAKEDRIAVLDKAFADSTPLYVMNFLKVLCSNGHIRCLPECVEQFESLYNTAKNLSKAYVTSAVPLDEAAQASLRKALEQRLGRSITLVTDVDPSLLGGMVVRVDGKVFDGSLKHRLNEIKEVMNA